MHRSYLMVPSPQPRAESYLSIWVLLEALNSQIGHFFEALHVLCGNTTTCVRKITPGHLLFPFLQAVSTLEANLESQYHGSLILVPVCISERLPLDMTG